ncbi:hypothetical protein ACVGWR_02660, partial [Enterobacter hormaechei]
RRCSGTRPPPPPTPYPCKFMFYLFHKKKYQHTPQNQPIHIKKNAVSTFEQNTPLLKPNNREKTSLL